MLSNFGKGFSVLLSLCTSTGDHNQGSEKSQYNIRTIPKTNIYIMQMQIELVVDAED